MVSASEVFSLASKLPVDQRAELAEALLLSLEPDEGESDVEEAWIEEALRRSEEIRQGKGVLLDWRTALEEIRRSLPTTDSE